MAGDWIKMRMNLPTCPQVVRISSALNADRLRVCGALLVFWSLFNEHSEDGLLDGYSLDLIDTVIGWPGFAQALVGVGWLTLEGDSARIPDFSSHNGSSAKRRASDAERKQSVRKMSAIDADKKRTREEKRREDIEPNGSPPLPPAGLDIESWNRWTAYRTKIKKPIRPPSVPDAQEAMAKFGDAQAEVVKQSIANGWQGLFALKPSGSGPGFGGHGGDTRESHRAGVGRAIFDAEGMA